MIRQNRVMTWAGWILTTFIGLMLTMSAVMKFLKPGDMVDQFTNKFGYPAELINIIGILELGSLVLFLIPQTSVLGAILLTGYFGGAIATHVRIEDPFFGGVLGGVLVWLALFLRDARIRAILPFRTALARESPTPPPA